MVIEIDFDSFLELNFEHALKLSGNTANDPLTARLNDHCSHILLSFPLLPSHVLIHRKAYLSLSVYQVYLT